MSLRRRSVPALRALALVSSVALAAGDRRVPTVDDLLNVDTVGSVRVAPDGKWVAYTMTHADFKKDAFVTHVWVADAAGGRNYQLTRGDSSVGDMAWSPDGRWLALTSDRSRERDHFRVAAPVSISISSL